MLSEDLRPADLARLARNNHRERGVIYFTRIREEKILVADYLCEKRAEDLDGLFLLQRGESAHFRKMRLGEMLYQGDVIALSIMDALDAFFPPGSR